MAKKVTGSTAAKSASSVLTSKNTGTNSKSVAASALSQTKAPNKSTSRTVATKASAVLRDGRTSAQSKTAAGSALAQTTSRKKGGR